MSFMRQIYCACRRNKWQVRQDGGDEGHVYCVYCDTTIRFTIITMEYSV